MASFVSIMPLVHRSFFISRTYLDHIPFNVPPLLTFFFFSLFQYFLFSANSAIMLLTTPILVY